MSTAVQQFHEEEAIGSKFDRGSVRRLLRYLKPYRRMIVPALLLTLGVNALGVIEPKFFQYAIDWYITPAIDRRGALPASEWAGAYSEIFRGLGLLSLVFLGVKLLQLLVSYFQAVLLESVGQRVMYDLRAELYEKLQRQEVAYFDRNPVGSIETIFYYAVFFPLVDFIGSLGVALIIWYGGWRVMQNTPTFEVLSIGALVAFIQYSQRLFQPIRDISDKYNIFQAALVASHRIFRTLDQPVLIRTPDEPKKVGRARGRVEFRNVWFAYKEEDWVLKDVSFAVEPGETVALVGHTGSGKTTITNLLMRFYDVQRGQVLLDGVDVREWDLKSLRENFAVVLQDVFLFSGTVAGNIRLGREDVSDERVSWAAREVHADGFIERLPGGYKSEVRERGAGLSVGQKQLISFARALAFDPALLILDEATSSIDTETEQLIQQAIERVLRDRTSIVVAHRLSTVQRADQILVLHHGELRERGTHQQLLARHDLYWRLYKFQYADDSRTDAVPELPLGDSLQYGD